MFCSKCGAQMADHAAFCSACGQPTGVAAAAPRGIPLAPGGFAPPAAAAPAEASGVSAMPPTGYAAPAAAPAVAYAGFWLRFVAWILDHIILQFAFSFIAIPYLAASGLQNTFMNAHPQNLDQLINTMSMFPKLILLSIAMEWLYYALMESSAWQATLGKKALGLEVTDMQGRRISFARASGRYFGKILSGLTLLIGYIMAGFTAQKQALHDMVAGCLVLRKL